VPVELLTSALDRVAALDPDGLLEVLDRAARLMGPDAAVDRLLVPALREVGDRWERGELDVGAEHLATAAARRWVARGTVGGALRPAAAPVVLAAAPGNRHTVALEAFGMLLHCRGWPTRLLGADTPVEALVRAVVRTGAQAAVITAHQVSRRRQAVEALAALAGGPARLYFAGAAFDSARHRRDVPGTYLGTVLPEAAEAVGTELRAG
jgi:methanogenic corrinoid protein MtbC1